MAMGMGMCVAVLAVAVTAAVTAAVAVAMAMAVQGLGQCWVVQSRETKTSLPNILQNSPMIASGSY
jgi:hypothetical protein